MAAITKNRNFFKWFFAYLCLICIIGQNRQKFKVHKKSHNTYTLNIMLILRWSPFKIVSVSAVLYPIWPPLLKIEISSYGQNCSILNPNVPKFELYKHNNELFNIYYGKSLVEIGQVVSNKKIFKWFFAYLCLICIIGQNRQKFKVHKNPVIYVKKLIIMLIQFKFGHFLA
jgi:hypothetical protein